MSTSSLINHGYAPPYRNRTVDNINLYALMLNIEYIPKLETISASDYFAVSVAGILFIVSCFAIYLTNSNWIHQTKMSKMMTLYFVASLFLQLCNALQFAFNFPLIANDIFNLMIYAYMGSLVILGTAI
jgi:uncharacterized membrane protein